MTYSPPTAPSVPHSTVPKYGVPVLKRYLRTTVYMSHRTYSFEASEWFGVCKQVNLASNHDSESFRTHPRAAPIFSGSVFPSRPEPSPLVGVSKVPVAQEQPGRS